MGSLTHIRSKASQIRDAALGAAERHYAAETPWFYATYWLGIPPTILAAIAGVSIVFQFPFGTVLAATCSILVAVFSSTNLFLSPSVKANIYHNSAKNYEEIYHEARYFVDVDLNDAGLDLAAALDRLGDLSRRFNELNRSSPSISSRASRIAERHLAKGTGEVVRERSN